MEELRFHFQDYQFGVFLMWIILTIAMSLKGKLDSYLGKLSLISVTSVVGYICLISFDILGAGYSKGIILPNFDAYIDPFLLFFFGIPTVMITILILYVVDVLRIGRFQPVTFSYSAISLYVLWSVLIALTNVIAGI